MTITAKIMIAINIILKINGSLAQRYEKFTIHILLFTIFFVFLHTKTNWWHFPYEFFILKR